DRDGNRQHLHRQLRHHPWRRHRQLRWDDDGEQQHLPTQHRHLRQRRPQQRRPRAADAVRQQVHRRPAARRLPLTPRSLTGQPATWACDEAVPVPRGAAGALAPVRCPRLRTVLSPMRHSLRFDLGPLRRPPRGRDKRRAGGRLSLEPLEDRTLLNVSFAPPNVLPVGSRPDAVVTADLNNDGRQDVVVLNQGLFPNLTSSVSVLLGNGDGSFRPRADLAVSGVPRAVVVGDFNGDGKFDVAVASQLSDSVSVLLGNGDGPFARPLVFAASGQNFTPSSMAVGDVNGDGKLDLVINSIGGEDSIVSQLGVLLGNGDGTFRAPILQSPGTTGGGGALCP